MPRSARWHLPFTMMLALLALVAPGRAQQTDIDALLAQPPPPVPAGLRGAAPDPSRGERIARRVESMFAASPLAPGGRGTGVATPAPFPPPLPVPPTPGPRSAFGPERHGWAVSGGRTLAYTPSPDVAACRAACAGEPGCVAYTWVRPGG
ncbi:MAG: PAN domain-containing protein [Hyphomicrobiales bacterium]|nr:PAN domain-containing protein [Hyphomicrobiales bacterium]